MSDFMYELAYELLIFCSDCMALVILKKKHLKNIIIGYLLLLREQITNTLFLYKR